MKKFSEMGVTYTPADGKKRFPGKVTRLGDIVNITIEIHDYETLDTKFGEDRYLVSFKNPVTQEWGKFFHRIGRDERHPRPDKRHRGRLSV